MEYPIDKYKTQAATAFSNLLTTFKTWGNGWQVGNVFDTMTDYVLRFPDAEQPTGAVVEAALERWGNAGMQGSMCWYDDWGWWGIASIKAFYPEYQKIFGEKNAIAFQTIASGCWKTMYAGKPDNGPYKYKGGPNVWENRDAGTKPGYFTSKDGWAVPRFPGGVWQYDMFYDERTNPKDCSPSNPADPKKCYLGPFQNTVMNALYLELAILLAQQGMGPGAASAIKPEMNFLNEWFSLKGDESLLQSFDDDSTLVRERVATYASMDGNKTYPGVEGYYPDGAWCGDQGLMLGAFLDYSRLASDPTAESQAISIARGVLLHMVDAKGIVMPFSAGFNDQGDPDDYSCGSGVFWRYLLRGFRQSELLQKEVWTLIDKNPENNPIFNSAENPYAHAPKNLELFKEFNALAVLLAAIEILGGSNA